MQINFGVILNEAMADSVKVTVIATGFQPEGMPVPMRPAVDRKPATGPHPGNAGALTAGGGNAVA